MSKTYHAAIYARVSTEAQAAKGGSIRDQVERAERLAAEYGLTVTHRFKDEGISGALFSERGALQSLLDLARTGAISVVIYYDGDRVARDWTVYARIVQLLERENGVQMVDLSNPQFVDPATFNPFEENRTVYHSLKAIMADMDRMRLLRRTEAGRRRKVAEGKFIFSHVAFGYRAAFDPATGERYIEPDPATYPALSHFPGWVLSGMSALAIAQKLDEMGVKPPHSARWDRTSVARIIKNPLYAGRLVWGRTSNRGGRQTKNNRDDATSAAHPYPHPWTWEEFTAMGEALSSRARRKDANATSGKAPLGPFLRCECGRGMVLKPTTRPYGKYYYFQCSGWSGNHANCTPHTVSATRIMQALKEEAGRFAGAIKNLPQFEAFLVAQKSGATAPLKARYDRTVQELDTLDRSAGELDDRLLEQRLDFDTFTRLAKRLEEKRARLVESLTTLEGEIKATEAKELDAKRYLGFADAWERVAASLDTPLPDWSREEVAAFRTAFAPVLNRITVSKQANTTLISFEWGW